MNRELFNCLFNRLALMPIALVPLLFMTLRGWTNTGLIVSAFLVVIYAIMNPQRFLDAFKVSHNHWFVVVLSLPFISVLVSQCLRGEFSFRMLDGPSRAVLAGLVFLFCYAARIRLLSAMQYVLPLSLFISLVCLYAFPETSAFWGGRNATYFADPLTFGDYSLCIGFMCLMICEKPKEGIINSVIIYLNLIAFVVGLIISFGSLSRSGWLAIPALVVIACFRYSISYYKILLALLICLVLSAIYLKFNQAVYGRFVEMVNDVQAWFVGNKDTSGGIRLTLYVIGINLFLMRPFSGWGDKGYFDTVNTDPNILLLSTETGRVYANGMGFHNEYISNLVHSGVLGLIGLLFFLFTPVYVVSQTVIRNKDQTKIAFMIYSLCIGLSICAFTVEIFYLKYAISFYSYMVAVLIAQYCLEEQSS